MTRRPTTWLAAAMLVGTAFAAPSAGAREAAPSGEDLRARRAALLTEIAVLTDALAQRQAGLVGAQHARARAEALAARAVRALQEHAVEAFIHSHELAEASRLRSAVIASVVADADGRVVDDLRRARAASRRREAAAERAVAAVRSAEDRLEAARVELERTLARTEALEEEARRNAEARRIALLARPPKPMPPGATRRHREATARQAELMATYPFGPLPGSVPPPGLATSGHVVEGMASWYGPGFDGRATASGAIYDQEGWTVASRTLPLGTMLLVTRGERSVLVLVNDRGPYVDGRVLDLSHGVAQALGTVRAGVAWVTAEVVEPAP